jgi:4-amino-4-deoxy-L-arabinose transferase-like glycosyltransferase
MTSAVENPAAARVDPRNRWPSVAPLLVAVVIYLVLAVWLARTKAPWCDEGQYANSSYDLAFRGHLSTSVVEPSGYYVNAYFRGAQQRTYFTVPIQLVALAGFFRAFGASAFSARLYSILWGVITLLILFYIVQRVFPGPWLAPLATLLTAVDFVFLWSTADARMDAAASALGLASLAAYLHLREKHLDKAVAGSQALGACAVFTHPNSVLVVLALAVMACCFDRERLGIRCWRYLALTVLPYLFLGLLWSLYILQSPKDFAAQFVANAAGHNSERFRTLIDPGIAIGKEIDRHLSAYCIGGLWGGVMPGFEVLIPLLYLAALVWFLSGWRGHTPSVRMLFAYAVAMILGTTFLDGFKGYFYLIYLTPLYTAVLAAWLGNLWSRSAQGKCAAAAIALAFLALQLATSIQHIRADEYHRDYEPTVRELERDRAQGKTIVGTAALGFGLGFSGFKDDARLGKYSGLTPDVLVMDRSYRDYAGFYAAEEPAVFDHIVTLLSEDYRLSAQHGSLWIFERAQTSLYHNVVPRIDAGEMKTVESRKRAAYFFRIIFSAYKMRDLQESSL